MKTHLVKPREARRWVVMFRPEFAGLVEAGVKRQTVRPRRKDGKLPLPGDIIDARAWTGRPYGSPQRKLGEWVCQAAEKVEVERWGMRVFGDRFRGLWSVYSTIGGKPATALAFLTAFAKRDGFESWPDMLQWFMAVHRLPLEGAAYFW